MAKLELKKDSYDFILFTGENCEEVARFVNDIDSYYERLEIAYKERKKEYPDDDGIPFVTPYISGLHRDRDDRDVKIGEYIVYFYENKEYVVFSKYQFEQTFNVIKMSKLTQRQILTALLEGKKIRQIDWGVNEYIHLVGDELKEENGQAYPNIWFEADWFLYIETITFFEALEAIIKGGKVRFKNEIIYLNDKGHFVTNIGTYYHPTKEHFDTKWQILEGDNE